ncbi:MAG TPA: hypothetical protein VGX03_02120 [Candidatus Binatia bacterium]|jgi:hypothetical protein|nr:hypothetical protein [Candidatus Binatia bacterium]
MKNIAGLIVPVVLILVGAYALFTALGSSGEQVALFGGQVIPRGLALVMGLIGLGGGAVVIINVLASKKRPA